MGLSNRIAAGRAPVTGWTHGTINIIVVVDADTKLRPKRDRAVVLVHGLLPHVFHSERATKPDAHEWVSFLWVTMIGCVITMAVGRLVSALWPERLGAR